MRIGFVLPVFSGKRSLSKTVSFSPMPGSSCRSSGSLMRRSRSRSLNRELAQGVRNVDLEDSAGSSTVLIEDKFTVPGVWYLELV